MTLEKATATSTHEVQQAMALARETMDQLAAELSAEANELDGPDLLARQALALPRRAVALRDLSIALRELINLERRQLGLDDGAKLLRAYVAMAANAGPLSAAKEEGDG